MPGNPTPVAAADMRAFLRCNQTLAQHLDGAPPWLLCGLRWYLQCFYYCCPVESDYRVTMHQHDWFEIALLCKGRLQYRTPKHAATFQPGDIFFMPPGRQHSWSTLKAPVVIASLQIKVGALEKSGQDTLQSLLDRVDAGHFHIRRNPVHTRLHQTMWELLHQSPPSPLLADKLRSLTELFVQEMIDRAAPQTSFPQSQAPFPIDPESVATSKYQQIVDFVHQNINQPIQLEDIASHFHYSVRHIARIFREESGVALGRYIVDQKLRAAQRLLATTDHPVKTIAFDLGYHDVGYFRRLFRTHLMGTPNGYRAQMLSGRRANPYGAGNPHTFRGTTSPIPPREAPAEPRVRCAS